MNRIIFLLFLFLFCGPVRAQTPQQIRDAIDTRLIALMTAIQSRQTTYFGSRNRYFQGLITHAAAPSGTTDVNADRLSFRPTDQIENWSDFGVTSLSERFAVKIDVYDGPAGKGYVVIVFV